MALLVPTEDRRDTAWLCPDGHRQVCLRGCQRRPGLIHSTDSSQTTHTTRNHGSAFLCGITWQSSSVITSLTWGADRAWVGQGGQRAVGDGGERKVVEVGVEVQGGQGCTQLHWVLDSPPPSSASPALVPLLQNQEKFPWISDKEQGNSQRKKKKKNTKTKEAGDSWEKLKKAPLTLFCGPTSTFTSMCPAC